MTDARAVDAEADPQIQAATKGLVFSAAERLFAIHGFQNVSVRDITAEAGVNLASLNYHFGSKDALLFDIFGRRTAELNCARARMLREATERHAGKPPLRAILEALIAPPVQWLDPHGDRLIAAQFLIRARGEGTAQTCEGDVGAPINRVLDFAEAGFAR